MKKVSQTKTKNNSGHMGQSLSHVTKFKLCFHFSGALAREARQRSTMGKKIW